MAAYTVAYYKNLELGEMIPANRHVFTDQMVVLPGKYLAYLSIYKNLFALLEQGIPLHPETILYYCLVYQNHLQVTIHPEWLYEIFRNGMEPIENDEILQEKNINHYSKLGIFKYQSKEVLKRFFPSFRKLCQIHETLMTIQQGQFQLITLLEKLREKDKVA